MYIVTFYSFRGGVGRTTALVNVGIDLAQRGRNVLLVDFDLESPDLTSFSPLGLPASRPGMVDYVAAYRETGEPPDVADYLYPVEREGLKGRLWMMPAGRVDADYWAELADIDWQGLYDREEGFLFFEDTRAQWKKLQPDYVLIDTHAGITPALGINTRQLANAVVVLFTHDSAGDSEFGVQAGVHHVLWDVVWESLQSRPPRIDVLTVATKVPDLDGEDFHADSLTTLFSLNDDDPEDIFVGPLDATIPHANEMLFKRQIVVNPRPRKRLPKAYRRLANALIRSNYGQDREGAQAFLKETRPGVAVPASDVMHRWSAPTARLEQVLKNFHNDAGILAQAASCLFLAERYDEALRWLDEAIDLAPTEDCLVWQAVAQSAGHLLRPVWAALADYLLWQRASYRLHLNNVQAAVDDLLRVLDAPRPSLVEPHKHAGQKRDAIALAVGSKPHADETELDTTSLDTAKPLTRDFPRIDPFVASAFQQLRKLAPDKVEDALQKHRIQQLSAAERHALITDVPDTPLSADPDTFLLIRKRQWRAAITRLETGICHSPAKDPEDLFFLGMAYWGSGDDIRATERCKEASELILNGEQPEAFLQHLDLYDLQELPRVALTFWRAGDTATARRVSECCDAFEGNDLFSFWRLYRVDRHQFNEDCESLRRMIQGVPLRPPFLGKEPGMA